MVLLSLRTPADNQRGPRYAAQALSALHQGLSRRDGLRFVFNGDGKRVGLSLQVVDTLRGAVEHQLLAAYPDCRLEPLDEESCETAAELASWSAGLWLRPDIFPLRSLPEFDDPLNRNVVDPLTGILATLRQPSRNLRPSIEISVRPAGHRRLHRSRRILQRLAGAPFANSFLLFEWYARAATSRHGAIRILAWFATCWLSHRAGQGADERLHAAERKLGQHLFEARIRIIVAGSRRQALAAKSLLREIAGAFGQFTRPHHASWHPTHLHKRGRPRRFRRGFLLAADELAALWHPPTATVRAERLDSVIWRQQEPPQCMPSAEEPGVAVLGRVTFRGRRDLAVIRRDDRRRHLHVLGKTGMGKSSLILRMLSNDIAAGHGACLLDPHGDLVEASLTQIGRARTNDVVLFDAGEREFPVSFNPLHCDRPDQQPLVADGVLSALKRLFGDSWGPRMEDILRNALLALGEIPGATLLNVQKLLSSRSYRAAIVTRVRDPVVRDFWQTTFASWPDRYRIEAIAPVENKLRHFTSNPILRGILGQPQSSIDLRRIMDAGQVLLVNLSKGRIGDDASKLLGSLLTAHLQLAAMSRVELPEPERRDFFVYVDEFQSFLSGSDPTVATSLAESRKFGVYYTLAHQFIEQLDDATRAAIFGNVGSLVAFQVGATDAEILAKQFGGDLLPSDLMNLPRYTAYVRLLVDGSPSRPFSMTTLPPSTLTRRDRSYVVRATSRRRYGRPAQQVTTAIAHDFGNTDVGVR